MPTELVWEGKFDAKGCKKAPLRVQLPFQEVETVNESAQDREKQLDLFHTGQPRAWRNRLIWGDKKYVLPSLLPEFAGQINLIYIDPPFAVGSDFSFQVSIENETFTKAPSMLEVKAYRDTWGKGLDSYLQWFYETVILLHELLSEAGVIYVHLDEHAGHYAKVLLDEVFGKSNFLHEIVWHYPDNFQGNVNGFANNHNILLVYAKRAKVKLKRLEIPLEKAVKRDLRVWSKTEKKIVAGRDAAGNLLYRTYETKFADDVWTIGQSSVTKAKSSEWLGYPTQKPEELLRRVIESASNAGDLVLDCFCGSGTTPAVAEKLGRRWIAADLGRFAIHTTRKRLLTIDSVRPFVVQNLGKYERQLWQKSIFGPEERELQARYLQFILKLYHAQPLTGNLWLHGIKAQRGVHIGSIDAPITEADVRMTVAEWRRALGEKPTKGIDFLGWEFAFELNEITKQQATLTGADLRFLRIPREVLEQKAVEQGDIQFFELAALFVTATVQERTLTLKLTNFVLPLDYVPAEIQAKVTNWEAWIDYWAVDFAFKKDTFHNEWQSYRTHKANKIQTQVVYTYETPGTYQVQVKVIDLLGNDTTKTLQIVIAK